MHQHGERHFVFQGFVSIYFSSIKTAHKNKTKIKKRLTEKNQKIKNSEPLAWQNLLVLVNLVKKRVIINPRLTPTVEMTFFHF